MPDSAVLLKVRHLRKEFRLHGRRLLAVNDVSFDLYQGETLALVGESGCGKTTLGKALMQLEKPTAGSVVYSGVELVNSSRRTLKKVKRKLQFIFQDPYASFDPRMTLLEILNEPLQIHRLSGTRQEQRERAKAFLQQVGLDSHYLERYPHALSGGQRQRLGIARALALQPELIICDEPVSALDVSVQAQIVNLLKDLQERLGLSYLFITHQLSVVHQLAHRVAVMYLGQVVELGKTEALFLQPLHPYTQALLSAIPRPDPKAQRGRERIVLHGDVPSPLLPPLGCPFHTRCPFATEICRREMPVWKEVRPGQVVRCHLYN